MEKNIRGETFFFFFYTSDTLQMIQRAALRFANDGTFLRSEENIKGL